MQCKSYESFLFDTNFYRNVSPCRLLKSGFFQISRYDKIYVCGKYQLENDRYKEKSWDKWSLGISIFFKQGMPRHVPVYKIILAKRNLELNDLRLLCYSKKSRLDFSVLYRLFFLSSYHQNGLWNIKFLKLLHIAAFLWHCGAETSYRHGYSVRNIRAAVPWI